MKKLALVMTIIMALTLMFGCTNNFMSDNEMIKLTKNPEASMTLTYTDKNDVVKTFTMVYELHYEKAPITVTNFVNLIQEKFYNDSLIHYSNVSTSSYDNIHYIEGGAYKKTKDEKIVEAINKKYTIKGEFKANEWKKNDLVHTIGNLVMDRTSGANGFDTASTMFYICLSDHNKRDGNYAVFGTLKGMSGKIGEQVIPMQDEIISTFLSDMASMTLTQSVTDKDDNSFKIPTYTIAISMTVDTFGTTFPSAKTIKK
ncbi:MAG: peptidylprolyl isomerase [Clostridia bacterium]